MKVVLWKGYHSTDVRDLIAEAWAGKHLLILYPPPVDAVDFLPLLPEGPVEARGEWRGGVPANAGGRAPAYPDVPVLGLFSTGTTGQKLVLYSRRNIESSLHGILELFVTSRIRQVFCYPQPFHTFGLILGYVHCLLHGKTLVTGDGAYGAHQHALRAGLSSPDLLTLGTPTHFRDLGDYSLEKNIRLSSSYASIVGAAKVSVSLWRMMRDILGIEAPSIGYGATEASPGVTHLPPGREPAEDGEVGFPLSHVDLRLLPGEGIRFRGPAVCLAVLKDGTVEFPHEISIQDELERRADGVLVYRGRNELVLNRGGEKFPLEKMEALLRERLGVEAVCVPVPHGRLGEELGVLAKGEGAFVKERIYALLKESFHRDFDPHHFAAVSDLPLNASAKVDRAASAGILRRFHV